MARAWYAHQSEKTARASNNFRSTGTTNSSEPERMRRLKKRDAIGSRELMNPSGAPHRLKRGTFIEEEVVARFTEAPR